MTTIRVNDGKNLTLASEDCRHAWIDVKNPGREELELLERKYAINPEHLADIFDIDEQARIEKEDEYVLIILRLPVYDPGLEVPYYTVPFGLLLFDDRIVSICQTDTEVLEEIRKGRARGLDLGNKGAFVLHLLSRAAAVYLRYLKDINRRTAVIERELQRSVKNHELTQLLALEKSLVYFTTSLKSNEILLEKLQISRSFKFGEDETELLEDVLTDNKQAIEMANIYSDILSGMMDAFASVISNNLNMQMKRLTIISIVLMIPTLVVSVFGMNINLPFEDRPDALFIVLGASAVSALLGGLLLRDKRKPRKPKLATPAASGLVFAHPEPRR
jgi:magnesium transporter